MRSQSGKSGRKGILLFWAVFALALAVRAAGFVSVPQGVNQDEAMGAVDAWALSLYGTDRFGVSLPVHFRAWTVSQMSVLLSYCMVPFIRLLGFGTLAVRLPMLLASMGGVALMYLTGKKLWGQKAGLAVMALTAVNPWHFMQSRWSMDCNLFPHMFLLGFYLLLLGLEKRRYLYLSMIFFGLTFYCYGIAVYSVLPFLAVFALWCLLKKQLKLRQVLACVCIFLAVALPEILVMAINFFGWETIETPLFTMSRFPESVRGNDILFLNFSFRQLGKNLLSMVKVCILQTPDSLFNTLPGFGPLYHISTLFILPGAVLFTRDLFREKEIVRKTEMLALWGFLVTGIWVGLITSEVNVNRINIIFYPLLFMNYYGIAAIAGALEKRGRFWCRGAAAVAYGICFVCFLTSYFTDFPRESARYYNVNFLRVVTQADALSRYDRLYITGNMDWQYNLSMAEILTQYSCRIPADYYQEKTNTLGDRQLLPYSQRYHFVNYEFLEEADKDGLYLLHVSELGSLPFRYRVLLEDENYLLVTPE